MYHLVYSKALIDFTSHWLKPLVNWQPKSIHFINEIDDYQKGLILD